MNSANSIDEYISNFSPETQELLKKVRAEIRLVLPNAQEKISYGIPTFWDGKNIIHFAAFNRHIGIYPGAKVIEQLKEILKDYPTSKGAIQFSLEKPMPFELIKQIAECSAKLNKK